MWSQQVFVAFLLVCLTSQHVIAVVNSGQAKKIEEVEATPEKKENEENNNVNNDLVAESSESANRREAPVDTYGVPHGNINLPLPVYGVPNAPSNNVVYPAPPPDIPPPPPKLLSPLYGEPTIGKTYGVPQFSKFPPITKGFKAPSVVKYGAPSFSFNQFSTSLIPPKPLYGPPKNSYGVPGKPFKYHKYPQKNFAVRSPKPVYGVPFTFKDNFSHNKFNQINSNSNNLYTSNLFTNNGFSKNTFSSLYSGLSSLNHQYGLPISPPKQTLSLQYGIPPSGVSTQYGVPEKTIVSGPPIIAYGPPQPSPNPRPPHPGVPAPPTPPDIKYDGWQPIPGLISKRPVEEIHHLTAEGSGYHDLSPPPLDVNQKQIGQSYGTPAVTLEISHGNSAIDQQGISDSYGVQLNGVTGSKGVSDSYSAPLGTVTGSGGIVASSGAEAHGAGSLSHSESHSLSLDLSSVGLDHGSDIKAVKSIEYDIGHQEGTPVQISDSYEPSQIAYTSGQTYKSFGTSSHNYKGSLSSHGQKTATLSVATLGLVPPKSQYGIPQYTNTPGDYKNANRPGLYANHGKVLSSISGTLGGNSYLPPSPPVPPSSSYGVPSGSGAISFQHVAHGSSTAGINLQHSNLDISGKNTLSSTSYDVPLSIIDGSYTFPQSNGDISVSLDFSHPPVSIDLTQGRQISSLQDCYNKQQLQVPSLAYGVPSADSYTSSLSSLTTNIGNSHPQTVLPQASYGPPDLVAPQIHSESSQQYDLLHSSSVKTESKLNSVVESEETHGRNYGKSVAASFGPNSELVESQSIDLNNIPLQGNLGSYTLQIQSADGTTGQVPHSQVFNEGLLQSILQAIEHPGKQGEDTTYPIIVQPSVERHNYSVDETINSPKESHQEASEIREVVVEAPKGNTKDNKADSHEDEETLQLLDTSNIALYYKKDDGTEKVNIDKKSDGNRIDGDTK